jgi:trypsin-like peptidase/surface-adhesin protein E
MKRHYLSSLIAISLLAFVCLAQDAREVARQVLPSVVVVTTYDGTGRPLTLASGFFVTENIVVTNFHVIEGSSDAAIKVVGESKLHRVTGVVAVSKERDLVLLQVSDVRGTPLALSTTQPEIGEDVYAFGNPEALEGSISPGIVSSKGTRRIGGEDLIQVTAPISHGSSGGPVVNKRGEAIGVAESFLTAGQNLNFAVPSRYLTLLLSQVGSSTPISSITSPRPVPAANWILIGSSTDVDMYYDAANVQKSRAETFLIRTKLEPRNDATLGRLSSTIEEPPLPAKVRYGYLMSYEEWDCGRSSYRTTRIEDYDSDGKRLRFLDVPAEEQAWSPVKPSSLSSPIFRKICSANSSGDNANDLLGTYTGTWASNSYSVSGALVLTMAQEGGQMTARVVLTGSEYFNEDTLLFKLTPMGSGVWKMDYKGKKSKMTGTGLFRGGRFVGDYRFSKLLWVDRGRWNLQK